MATRFVETTLDRLKEGQWLRDAESAFADLQKMVIEQARKLRRPIKGKLNLSVSVAYDPEKETCEFVHVRPTAAVKLPYDVTIGHVPNEEAQAYCAVQGTHHDDPKQGQLCKEDGSPL